MTFNEASSDDFRAFSREIHSKIKSFEGCTHLEIYRDLNLSNVFFSYSHWDSENDLENYRKSEFFKTTWTKVRAMFSDRPVAWSVEKVI